MPGTDKTRTAQPGDTLTHYRLLEPLGAGGMGEVFKAEDLKLHRPVAIKLLLSSLLENEEARRRFLREARAASVLNHPNIATIYAVDEVEWDGQQQSFIVMEFVQGTPLDSLLRKDTLKLAAKLEIIGQIADALSEAHGRGIVHRDVKPSNVMLTESGRVKVLDFGLAKFHALLGGAAAGGENADATRTMPGTVMGTLSYMSPEQAMGRDVDHRSDIFSLGVVLYEVITGQLPFRGSSTLAIVDGILHNPSPSPSRVHPGLPAELERITQKMLEKDRERRYQSMREVFLDLDAIRRQISGSHHAAALSTPDSGSRTQVLRERATDTTTTALAARYGKSLAVLTFSNITKNIEDDWLGIGMAETVTADLTNIEGVTVIGRERIHEVLRNINAEGVAGSDEKLATRVGREVAARWIVSGGYQRLGEMLRITARFVEVETGEVVKTVKIDGRMGDIFELQDKIVYELSQFLHVGLKSAEREGIELEETDVIEAYEAFTKGMMNLRVGSPESLDRALFLFDRAVALDPHYARAFAALGAAYELKGQFQTIPELFDRAIAAYQKAIELRPLLPEAYRGLGMVFLYQGREDEAIGAIRRALALFPADFGALAALGRTLFLGKADFRQAAETFEKAMAANPKAGWVILQLAYCYALLGELDKAEAAARMATPLQENYTSGKEGLQIVGAFARLGHVYFLQGRYEEAITELQRELSFLAQANHALKDRAGIEVHQRLASVYMRLGRTEDARLAYEYVVREFRQRLELGADEPFTRYYVACAHAAMGEAEQALDHLEAAARFRLRFTVQRARVEPDFESLRTHPRFQALLNLVAA